MSTRPPVPVNLSPLPRRLQKRLAEPRTIANKPDPLWYRSQTKRYPLSASLALQIVYGALQKGLKFDIRQDNSSFPDDRMKQYVTVRVHLNRRIAGSRATYSGVPRRRKKVSWATLLSRRLLPS